MILSFLGSNPVVSRSREIYIPLWYMNWRELSRTFYHDCIKQEVEKGRDASDVVGVAYDRLGGDLYALISVFSLAEYEMLVVFECLMSVSGRSFNELYLVFMNSGRVHSQDLTRIWQKWHGNGDGGR